MKAEYSWSYSQDVRIRTAQSLMKSRSKYITVNCHGEEEDRATKRRYTGTKLGPQNASMDRITWNNTVEAWAVHFCGVFYYKLKISMKAL